MIGKVAGTVEGACLFALVSGKHGADDVAAVLVAHLHAVGIHQQDVIVVIFRDELLHVDFGIFGVQSIHIFPQPVK